MRLSGPNQDSQGFYRAADQIPLEVNLWLKRGWTILPSDRNGVVLLGEKQMRRRDKVLLWLGGVGFFFFAVGIPLIGQLGLLFLVVAGWDYGWNTNPPTKFFPARGDKVRSLER